MEGNGLPGRMYSNMGGGGMLGLEMPLHPPLQQQQPQNPQIHLQKHPQFAPFTHQQGEQQQTQLSMKQPNYTTYNNTNTNQPQKPKAQVTQFTTSDEDEPGCSNEQENSSFDGKRKGCSSSSMSPWQRMKWTDSMVRLLIMAVYYIGDEAGVPETGAEKKKQGSGGGNGLLQKKGKWKSVSRAMMEKGFYVSPQQCEDKFNDLNKRYKRVNDILGRGTACRVVENQSLLEGMEIAPKMKEEVKKLLNSKHLFFREMCAYHNSCGHGPAAEAAPTAVPPQQHPQQQQSCSHSADVRKSSMVENNAHRLGLGIEGDHDEDEEDDEEDSDEDEFHDEEEEHEEGGARKRARTTGGGGLSSSNAQALQQLSGEVVGMLRDVSKSSWEKKQWVMTQLVQLEEQGVKFQLQALELEKQRLKWIKFSSKKEREMEKMKIHNERKRLENERMVLLLRQKEIELLLVEQQQQHASNPSCVTT